MKPKHTGECAALAGLPCRLCELVATNDDYRDLLSAPAVPPSPPAGVGTELHALMTVLGFTGCNSCHDFALKMDAWGLDACKGERRQEIIDRLREHERRVGIMAKMRAGGLALWHGLPLTPEGILDLAVQRAEDKQRRPFDADVQFVAGHHNGLGDRLILLAVAEGYAQAHPERRVAIDAGTYKQWIDLFATRCRVVPYTLPAVPSIRALDGKYTHWHNYDGRNPWECCAAIAGPGVRAVLSTPRPSSCLSLIHRHAGAVVLAPFAAYPIRTWPLAYWLRLETLLLDAGYRVVILDDRRERCSKFQSPAVIRRPAREVAALLRVCACLIANESGMQHVAGCLRVPTIVLASVFKGFTDLYPNTTTLSGGLECDWCHQEHPKGRLTRAEIGCDTGACQSLRAISPQRVFEEVARVAVDQRRRHTMQAFLDALPASVLIVETGCQRQANDYGAGMSTTVFAKWCNDNSAVESVDNDPAHVAIAGRLVPEAEVFCADSVHWLRGKSDWQKIDGLYLDSQDTDVPGFAEHCLTEAQVAQPNLPAGAVILIDDTVRDGDGWWGKGRLAVPWLLDHGWHIVEEGYQVLLARDRRDPPDR